MSHAEVIPVGLDPHEITIDIAPGPRPEPDAATDEVWARMRSDKPRLFDGDILAFGSWDADSRTIHARRDSYKRLTVQPVVATGVTQLSVTGLLCVGDGADRRVLLARRSPETRVYPNLWELAPSGGIDASPKETRTMTGIEAWRQLLTELREELGVTTDLPPAPVAALTIDGTANSCDLVFDVRLDTPIEVCPASWEYVEARWFAVKALPSYDELIPPTTAILDALSPPA